MFKKLLAIILILPLLAFCDKKEKVTPTVTISGEKEFSIPCEGGSVSFTFTCNTEWEVTADESWISLAPASGSASDNPVTVTFTCDQTTQKLLRTATITIQGKGAGDFIYITQAGDPWAGAGEELHSGDVLPATNPLVEKFLTEVTYPDKTYNDYTKIFDYYGGFGCNLEPTTTQPVLTWDNWGKEWPDGDIPPQYSIRWTKEDLEDGAMTLHLEDGLGWSGDLEIAAGALYVNVTNLVPNDSYSYKVTTASGKVLAQGTFTTIGTLHQCYFLGNPQAPNTKGGGGRNCRDFGGWKTTDGKTIKYRMVYRGGRLNEKWSPYPLNAQGEKEVLFEGIGAELDLRGKDDVMFTPAVEGIDHCAPVIEQGGKTMLVDDAAKTKECFEFVVNSLRKGKPVHFHCSLGRDRTGTLGILLFGILGVPEGDISKEYELTYFAPVGYSVSSSDKKTNTKPIFHNTRMTWVYKDVAPYFWELAGEGGTFKQGVEKYLLEVAGVSQQDIDDFRSMMLE
ncbi:MAG: tyrosine-protein phosphatase [Bacteroidales bacterium]|nr:tyrosine-protein phosphatase [Bacteroidales bacterium]